MMYFIFVEILYFVIFKELVHVFQVVEFMGINWLLHSLIFLLIAVGSIMMDFILFLMLLIGVFSLFISHATQ